MKVINNNICSFRILKLCNHFHFCQPLPFSKVILSTYDSALNYREKGKINISYVVCQTLQYMIFSIYIAYVFICIE